MSGNTFSKRLALLVCAAVLALPNVIMAQAESLDPTFGTNGIVTTANTVANARAMQSDGKIVVAGSIANSLNFQQGGLLRYTSNGVLDSSFGTGGKVLIGVGSSEADAAFATAIQTDGKIVTAAPLGVRLTVFRFNSNGTVDNSFGTNGSETITAAGLLFSPVSGGIALQSDGKIVVVTGDIVARLLGNGQLDSTFGSGGVAPTVGGNSVAILSNDQILIGSGNVTSLYTPNGSLVTRFGVNGQTAGFPFNGIAANAQQTETYGIANDGTPLHWETLQPSGSGPRPFVLLIHGGGFKAGDTHLPFNTCAQDVVNAGYFAASIEYRLAPPGHLLGQMSDGRFPDQPNDIELAAMAARADPRCNGEVFAIGGSAGASHSAWLAGKHLVNAAVLMSPAMEFDDPTSLRNSNFNHDVTNYAPNNLSAASPINVLASHAAPIFLVAFQQDSIPAPRYLLTVAKLAALGVPPDSQLLPGQGHSFDAWPTIKGQAITFLNAHRTP